MPSSRRPTNDRRNVFLNLSAQIEGQLREAYDRKYHAGLATQSSLADKLNVNRSAIHHRLNGHTNMTIETIADMVWALDHAIKVEIYDPAAVHGQNFFVVQHNVDVAPSGHAGQNRPALRTWAASTQGVADILLSRQKIQTSAGSM